MTESAKRVTETRSFHAGWEIREAEDGKVGLRGYAALFDSPAHGEVIRSGAFTKTLADGADVRMLVNHDGVPIARSKSGSLILSTDERGLVVDVPSLDMSNPTVQELVSAMRRGDIDQMSFAFSPVREQFNKDSRTRELLEVRLFDVSVVTYPWYDTTSVGLRDVQDALVEVRSADPETQATALNGLLAQIEVRAEMDAETLACVSGCLVLIAEADARLDAVLAAMSMLLEVPNPDEDAEGESEDEDEEGEEYAAPEVSETDESARFARREIARALYLR
jgi:HK97 family phage prohead protease